MIDPLAPFVEHRGAAVLDGGLATELMRRGLDVSGPLWSASALLDAPDLVEAVHLDYLDAGADVITTATYQATIPGFAARGLGPDEALGVLRSGVALALRCRDAYWSRGIEAGWRPKPVVAASIGSYGAFLADGSEYRGAYGVPAATLAAWHRPRLRALERSGAELLAFETIPSLPEAEAIAALLAETDGPPAWISFQARDASHLADGTPLADAAALAVGSARVIAVGVNCVPPALVASLLRTLRTATAARLAVYPNRGAVWDPAARGFGAAGAPVDFGAAAPLWREAGATLIGGCCGTTPADIRAIASAFKGPDAAGGIP